MNPERDQDRVAELFRLFNETGEVMFSQQRVIYQHLQHQVAGKDVLEVGCGTGQGTALLAQTARSIIGTDKSQRNVDFASKLYSWIEFGVWDILEPQHGESPIVIAVEVVEHIKKIQLALSRLIQVTGKTLWISTPNGKGKPKTPENPFHVREFSPGEILDMIGRHRQVTIRHWETWKELDETTDIDPLVYEVRI